MVSSTLADPAWVNTTVIGFEDIAGFKQAGDGPILVYGSARLAHALIENDLVDEYRAMINPVVIADGLRMFPSVEQMKLLRLTEAIPYALNAPVSGLAAFFTSPTTRSSHDPHRRRRRGHPPPARPVHAVRVLARPELQIEIEAVAARRP